LKRDLARIRKAAGSGVAVKNLGEMNGPRHEVMGEKRLENQERADYPLAFQRSFGVGPGVLKKGHVKSNCLSKKQKAKRDARKGSVLSLGGKIPCETSRISQGFRRKPAQDKGPP